MFGLLLLALVIFGCWVSLSLIGLLFKLVFGVIGGVFGLVGGFIGLLITGVVALALLPLLGLLMLPLLIPALLCGTLLWLLLRSPRRTVVIQQQYR